VQGVGRVERLGGVERAVRVEVDPVRMAALGVSAGDISRALATTQQQSSGGRAQFGTGEQAIRVLATVRRAIDIGRLAIVTSNGQNLTLAQVADVRDAAADPVQTALLDGRPVVAFRVYRALGQGEVGMDDGVRAALARLTTGQKGLRITQVSDSVDYTREQYRGSMDMLLEGAALAILIVFWFLRDWRATLVSAAALPLSVIPVFAAMRWFGFSLNTLTLLALAAVVGILVDDAIVEIENIVRHVRTGKTVLQATSEAVEEIGLAVVATTLTLAAVFIPTTMMNSIPGLFFREFGWTAALAVLASLLVARLLTPVMAVRWLRPTRAIVHGESAAMRGYLPAVAWCLAHRKSTLAAATLFLLLSLALVPLLSTGLLPASDNGVMDIGVELPPGAALSDTVLVIGEARAALERLQGVAHVLAVAGQGGHDASSDFRHATMTLALADKRERRPKRELEAAARVALLGIAGARFDLGSGNDDERLELILASDDDAGLTASARRLQEAIRGITGLSNVLTTADVDRPELIVRPDNAAAAARGVTSEAIGDAIRVATSGDIDARLSKLDLDERRIPIVVQIPPSQRADIQAMARLPVPARSGVVPLGSIARLSLESGPSEIARRDRRRYVSVTAVLGNVPLGDALQAARALPAALQLPPDVALLNAGNAENMHDLLAGFAMAMAASLLGIYCVLVLLFHDWIQPLTILSALPLSLGGAFLALLLTRSQLNIPSLIGMVMLMGVVTKNSILLVEYALTGMRLRGLDRFQAVMDACHKRARPIVMTTVAMISGLLPIALGLGADASFRQPMAMAVIGGLLTSTALSLLVVPVVFSLFTRSSPPEAGTRSPHDAGDRVVEP